MNVNLTGTGQITFRGTSGTITPFDTFTFTGDNSDLSTQALPANATLALTGTNSLFSHNAITSESAIGFEFGDGTNTSENSISADIETKKLTVKQSATLGIDSEKSLEITDNESEIAEKIEVKNGSNITLLIENLYL